MVLYDLIARHVAASPNKVALVTSHRDWTYADVDSLSAKMANGLLQDGLRAGDRLSAQVHKSPEALCLYLAAQRAGLIFHPLNTGYRPKELDYFIRNAGSSMVVTDPSQVELFADIVGASRVRTLDAAGRGTLNDVVVANDRLEQSAATSADICALLYSSGTTGQPKGIPLTHGNIVSNTLALARSWGFSSHDVLLHALPIFHVHGLFVALGCALSSGATMRWLNRFSVADVLAQLPECSVMMGVPTYYTRLLEDSTFTRERVGTMRLFVSGSAPLRSSTFQQFEQRTGHRILERYGMTETNIITSNPLHGARKPGTVGRALPDIDVRVVDENAEALPIGQPGRIQVRGPNVFSGYWRKPDATLKAFTSDGYFDTGDEGQFDTDGYLSIVGRSKDLIITGGLNVYPKEIEQLLDAMSGIEESAVIGVPHPDFGEAVVAVIAVEPEASVREDRVRSELQLSLAAFKLPKRYFQIAELPRNSMGKVQKVLLRERFAQTFAD